MVHVGRNASCVGFAMVYIYIYICVCVFTLLNSSVTMAYDKMCPLEMHWEGKSSCSVSSFAIDQRRAKW